MDAPWIPKKFIHGLINYIHFKLIAYPNISIFMDVVVIDVSNEWGLLLSRKWVASLKSSIQLDFVKFYHPYGR